MIKNVKNIMELLELKLNEGKLRYKTYRNMRLILNTEEKADNFKDYVEGMNNNCLELDCIAYRELVLNNRKYNIEITKKRLIGNKFDKHMWRILNDLFLEDLLLNEAKEALEVIQEDADNFLNFWNDRKGIPFSKLIEMYEKLRKVAA